MGLMDTEKNDFELLWLIFIPTYMYVDFAVHREPLKTCRCILVYNSGIEQLLHFLYQWIHQWIIYAPPAPPSSSDYVTLGDP